jgi:large repetitive protein
MELRASQINAAESSTEPDSDISNETARAAAEPARATEAAAGRVDLIPAGATILTPVDGLVRLPAGTRLDAIKVAGPNLIITLPDGQVFVIIDGALSPPRIALGPINISATNIAALIAGQEPEPAAGAPQSSGGNFVEAVGDIGDPFGLGDLLPPTDFAFASTPDDEFIPAVVDNEPEILIETSDQPAGSISATATVSEAALPARGAEPAGSDPASTAETVTGTIRINSPDQPSAVAVNGTAVTAVGQTIATPFGIFTVTSIAPDAIGYSYTLVDNSTNPAATDLVTITVTDNDGDVATATLTLTIADDSPTARADVENVAPNMFVAQTGNVISGLGTASGAAGADTPGADGASVTGIRAAASSAFTAPGTVVQGLYGSLIIQPSGNYSYVRASGTPGGVADIFTYQLTDGDGDVSTATLTFNIGDSGVGLVVPSSGDDGTFVSEAGLSERDGEPAGSRDGDGSTLTFGTIDFSVPDGPAIVRINGVLVTAVDQEIELPTGTLFIVAINRDSIEYAFLLNDNVLGNAGTQPITVTVTDQDGDSSSATFTIDIFDDSPTAVADTDRIAAGQFGPATGNVITDAEGDGGRDTQGADGAKVTAVSGPGGSAAVGVALSGTYGVLTLNADGSYSYVRNANTPGGVSDVFTYTLTDGDGDTSSATLTIAIGDGGVSITVPDGSAAGRSVSEAGLPNGSDPGSGKATTIGGFAISVTDGPGRIHIDGVELIAVGQTFVGAYGTLTITAIGATSIQYSYTLTSPSGGDDVTDDFGLRVTDSDGDSATGNLSIAIVDDVPSAADDVDLVLADGAGIADGNVLTGVGGSDANASDGAKDVEGADGAVITAVMFGGVAGLVDAGIQGTYGTLRLNSDGSYSYVLDSENPAIASLDGDDEVTETFTYTITDADGDESEATLTITIRGKDDIVVITGLDGEGPEATVSEANLADGSAPDADALVRSGSFSFTAVDGLATLTIGGVALFNGAIVEGLTIATAHGVLTITAFDPLLDGDGEIVGGTIDYSYALTDNLTHLGAEEAALTESFAVVITDSDGTSTTSSLDVEIIDDAPEASADDGAVGEGQTLIVDASAGLLTNDIVGADGATLVGVRAAAGDLSSPVSGGVGVAIAGQYGTLLLAADGSYSYVSNPNAVPPEGAQDRFVYTLRDSDGDQATTTLTISLSDSGLSTVPTSLTVDEAALAIGSNPGSDDESVSGDLNDAVGGGTGPFAFALVGSGTGTHGTLVLNSDGTYTYTLTAPVKGPAANNGTNLIPLVETFTYTATDAFGNVVQNRITIDVLDDVPTARAEPLVTIAEDAVPVTGNLLANDTKGSDGATVTSVIVGGVTVAVAPTGTTSYTDARGTYTFQANGLWSFDPVVASSSAPLIADFSYTITDGDGDRSTALQQIRVVDGANPKASAPVTLTLDDQLLESGSTPALEQPVTAEGAITFTQGSDAIVAIMFGNVSGLGGGLNWVRESDTRIVGMDVDRPVVILELTVVGNVATVLATLESNYPFHPDITADDLANLGQAFVVATDADGDAVSGVLNIVVSDDVPSITAVGPVAGLLTVDETNLAANATANLAALFNVLSGADQPVSFAYRFEAIDGPGLTDVATGSPITLHANGNILEGRVAGTEIVAFRLTIAADGQAVLDQIRAIRHSDPSNPDDPATIAASHIKLFATVTDSDGDQATASINIGSALVFKDDGPVIDISNADADSILLITQDGETRGAAFDTATANFSSAFTIASTNFGADGPGSGGSVSWSYALALGSGAAATGLTSNGVPITLALVAGEVVGSAGGVPIFSVSVNAATGVVKLTQFAEIDHPLPGSASDYVSQLLSLPANLIELRGTARITDRDGDSASETVAVDLGGNIRFADDGPSIQAGGEAPVLILDESLLAVDAVANLSGLFAGSLDFGADGAGSVAYQLGVTAGPSGLIDSLTGEAVVLSVSGGVVYGRTSSHEVFRISVDSSGNVTFDQSRAVIHSPDAGPDQSRFLAGTNLITLTAIVTDGDGDTALATADITGRFAIKDDAPVAVNDADSVARDAQIFADGNVLSGTGGSDANETDGVADSAGADGGLSVSAISFGAIAGTLGAALAGNYGTLTLAADGSYRYDLDINDPAVIALNSNQTLSEVFTYTVTDADGDSATATVTITITGANDVPVARADTNWVLDGPSGSDPTATGNVLQNIAHPGAPSGNFADVADTDPDLEPLTVTSAGTFVGLYGTLVIAADGAYTYTLNEDNPVINALDTGQTLTESFAYTVSDGLLSVGSTLTITVFGTNDAPIIGTATARISEEGLPGGIADTAPNATLDTTNSVTFSGTLAISDADAGETLTATLGNPGAVLTAGGIPVTWTGVGTGTLIGSAAGNEVIRITLTSNGAYTVTLSRAVDHPTVSLEDLKSFDIPVSVSDGTVTTTNASAIRVIIEDDAPTATGETGSSAQVQQDINTLFILDFSASIDDSELNVMLDAVKNALTLLDASALNALTIKFVIFSSSSFASPLTFTSAAAANAYLDSLNPLDGGTRPDNIGQTTNYTSAIQTALANFSAVPGAVNQVFFLSDGNPNSGTQFGVGGVINSLSVSAAAAWNAFVDNNNVNVTAIGIDNDPESPLQLQRLRDVDLNAPPNNEPILVEDFEALVATLLSVVVPPATGGDLDANDNYGADGGRILSITVGAVTYTWDGGSTISLSSGGTIAGTSISVLTPQGGTLQLNFATGQYNYQPPSPITVTATEVFTYTIVDRDGDSATASLSVTITALAPPVVLDLDGDGVEFLSSAAGVAFDFDGDGEAESTAWVGSDDGLLVFDRNGDGTVKDGSEIVFAKGNLTDLQGLAADHDSNKDGRLDANDTDFGKFAIWRDANSNGVVEQGELQSLSAAGIASISLVADGKNYATANGEVIVRGEAEYTRADGSKGKLADAAFATKFAHLPAQAAVPGANGVAAALAAAGLVAAMPLAAQEQSAPDTTDLLGNGKEPGSQSVMVEPVTTRIADDASFEVEQDGGNAETTQPVSHLRFEEHAFETGPATFDIKDAAPLPSISAENEGSGAAPVATPASPFAASGDQFMLPAAAGPATVADASDVNAIVGGAIEGQTIDLDAVLAAYAEPNGTPIQTTPAIMSDFLTPDATEMFLPNVAELHILAQMEQAAALGQA